jgi:hypothetical protein
MNIELFAVVQIALAASISLLASAACLTFQGGDVSIWNEVAPSLTVKTMF